MTHKPPRLTATELYGDLRLSEAENPKAWIRASVHVEADEAQ